MKSVFGALARAPNLGLSPANGRRQAIWLKREKGRKQAKVSTNLDEHKNVRQLGCRARTGAMCARPVLYLGIGRGRAELPPVRPRGAGRGDVNCKHIRFGA